MNPTNQADMTRRLNEAIALVNARRRNEAKMALTALTRDYPDVEQIWLWLVAVATERLVGVACAWVAARFRMFSGAT